MTKNRFTHLFQQNINFFNAEVNALIKKLNSGTKFSGIEYYPTNDKHGNQIFNLYCKLVNLPKGGVRNLKKIPPLDHTVFMTGYIQPDLSNKTDIITYCTEVNYCKISEPKNPLKHICITGFHYDVVIPEDNSQKDNNHPILHAQQNNQCGRRLFENPDYSNYKGNIDCDFPLEHENEIRTIRIPTPQMDMLSAVIMVIADYLVNSSDKEHKEYFTEFLRKIYNRLMPLSLSTFSRIDQSFSSQQKLLSIWYPL